MASQPPKPRMAACASVGTTCSAGGNRAVSLIIRMRERNRSSAVSVRWASSRFSWPKPFTTRTRVTASSTTPATSPIRCCASHVAGKMVVRSRTANTSKIGTAVTAIRVRGAERVSITTKATISPTKLPLMMGRNESSPWMRATSELARETSWPVCISSWRGGAQPSAAPVVAGEVKTLQPLVDRGAQVVLDVEGDPATEESPEVGGGEADQSGHDENDEPGCQRAVVMEDDVVDDDLLDRGRQRRDALPDDGNAEGEEDVAFVGGQERQRPAGPAPPRWAGLDGADRRRVGHVAGRSKQFHAPA